MMTLGKYQRIMQIQKKEKDDLQFAIEMVAAYLDKSIQEVEALGLLEFSKISKEIDEQIKEAQKGGSLPEFVFIENRRYKVSSNMNDLKLGQYIDMQIALGMCSSESLVENIHFLIATVLVDDNGKHIIIDDADKVKSLDYKDAYRIMLFFSRYNRILRKLINFYLRKNKIMVGL